MTDPSDCGFQIAACDEFLSACSGPELVEGSRIDCGMLRSARSHREGSPLRRPGTSSHLSINTSVIL